VVVACDPLRKDLGSPAERTWRRGQGEPRPRRTNISKLGVPSGRLIQGDNNAVPTSSIQEVGTAPGLDTPLHRLPLGGKTMKTHEIFRVALYLRCRNEPYA